VIGSHFRSWRFRHIVCAQDAQRGLPDEEEALKFLGELGPTAQDVAARLGAERIKARKGAASFQNPIVRYLKRRLEESGKGARRSAARRRGQPIRPRGVPARRRLMVAERRSAACPNQLRKTLDFS
jgi:hypothetical protein